MKPFRSALATSFGAAMLIVAPAMATPATCITDVELDAAVGDQLRSGSFTISTSKLREAPMCSGITVARAIQQLGERIRWETPVPMNAGSAPISVAPAMRSLAATRISPSSGTGRITGEFGYPSDFIPEDITACAEPVGGGREICSGKAAFKGTSAVYSINLSVGRYRVYARTSDYPGKKAYYTQSVICAGGYGGESRCNDHTPVIVDISAGEVRSRVNPDDWYSC